MLPCLSGEMKHQNLVSNKLIRVKFLLKRDNYAKVSGVSPLPERNYLLFLPQFFNLTLDIEQGIRKLKKSNYLVVQLPGLQSCTFFGCSPTPHFRDPVKAAL